MTSQRSKHPDWDEIWEKVQNWDRNWLRDYNKSHDVNQCTDEQGNTLLHHAVCDDHYWAVVCLYNVFIDPNIKNTAGQTALQLAQDTHPDHLEYLDKFHLCIDFDKASAKPNGLDALFAAIYRGDATLGDTSGVEDDGNESNEAGWTALQCAVVYDRPHLIRALHQRFPKLAADCLNYSDRHFVAGIFSALRLAVMRGHSNCIITLSECFPAIKADDVLHIACEYNRPACIPTLHQCFPQLTGNELTDDCSFNCALMYAAFSNNPECMRALHSCFPDIDPNLQDIDGDTPLMYACNQGLPQSITLLATYFPSIDVNMRNRRGQTALICAIERNFYECIVALGDSFPNIDPNAQDKLGWTALLIAANHSNPGPIISQLHELFPNIDPNAQNQSGQTALMLAIRSMYRDADPSQLRRLFPDIDPNKQDKDQNTALMYLLKSPDCTDEYVRHFLDTFPHVDANTQNAKGETALALAIEQGKVPTVALLLELFPDIIFLTNSALLLAAKNSNTTLISMLLQHIAQMQENVNVI